MKAHRRWLRGLAAAGAMLVILAPGLAEARGGFAMARGARMNMGGFHGGREFHGGHGFNAGTHHAPRFHPAVHPDHPPHPHPHPPPGPRPAPHPGPHHGPHPGPGPHPRPHPPPPPPPAPAPYWPGYWHDRDDFWWGAATAIAIGSIVASTPPDCVTTSVQGVTYKHCGTTWLRPEYQGHKLVYVVVDDPG